MNNLANLFITKFYKQNNVIYFNVVSHTNGNLNTADTSSSDVIYNVNHTDTTPLLLSKLYNDTIEYNTIANENNSENIGSILYKDTSKVFEIFYENIRTSAIYLTMISGGGCGGKGKVENYMLYSGGGGGSSSYIIRLPISLDSSSKIELIIGKGGKIDNTTHTTYEPTPSIFRLYSNNVLTMEISIPPGKNADFETGGEAGTNSYNQNGINGENGQHAFPSEQNVAPGKGGNSIYARGGDTQNINGSMGSGGAGGLPSLIDNSVVGEGGSGFILIEKS